MRRLVLTFVLAMVCLPATVDAAVASTGSFSVTMAVSKKSAIAGSRVTFSGRVNPSPEDTKVVIQRKSGKTWKAVAGRTVRDDGSYSLRLRLLRAGTFKYRAFVPARGGRRAGVSDAVTIKVYRWRYLSDFERVGGGNNFDDDATVSMAGRAYRKSLLFLWSYGSFGGWDEGSAEYNLGTKCIQFKATIGVDDTSGSRSEWLFAVSADDAAHDLGSGAFGAPKGVTVNLAGALRLKLEATRVDGDPYQDYKSDAAWGRARVLCAS